MRIRVNILLVSVIFRGGVYDVGCMTTLCTYVLINFLGYDAGTSTYEYAVFEALHTRAQVGSVIVYPTLSNSDKVMDFGRSLH